MKTSNSIKFPSPAISFIGRKNSGKTTITEKVISNLVARGKAVASVKHHTHDNFECDIKGKDSYRHHKAGATTSAIISPAKNAIYSDTKDERGFFDLIGELNNFDILVVEGFKKIDLPHFELLRKDNPRDIEACDSLIEKWNNIDENNCSVFHLPFGVITDIEKIVEFCQRKSIPTFAFDEIDEICNVIEEKFCRQNLSVVISAGGESKRMGQPKAFMPFKGKTLIEHAISLVENVADEIVVTTNKHNDLNSLKKTHPNLKIACDASDERGALPGFLTALSSAKFEHVGIIACDMVCFDERILSGESILLSATGLDASLPKNNGYWEPFCGVYKKSVCEKAFKQAYQQNERKLQNVLSQLNIAKFDINCLKHENNYAQMSPFVNVNTPEEVKFSEQFLQISH